MTRGIASFAAILLLVWNITSEARAQSSERQGAPDKQNTEESRSTETAKRVELNILGRTDSGAGESRRNENVQFNLVDNGALKELNIRLGTTATLIQEFSPASNYFGAEFGNPPRAALVLPAAIRAGFHGRLHHAHLNSITSARSFFQIGPVRPARENDYGFNFGIRTWKNAKLFVDASQQKIQGNVNGNVLVPRPDERMPLANDPATRALVARFLDAYPTELPNRTEINERALNTNALQTINNDQVQVRIDQRFSPVDSWALQYQFTSQNVDAFQLVRGQNPDTDTKSHLARIAWTRSFNPKTVTNFSIAYERLSSLLEPEENAVGPFVLIAGLTGLGPDGAIPIDRAQNQVRPAFQLTRIAKRHQYIVGATLIRRQINGSESDVHRGFFSFNNDFGQSAIRNLRDGRASQYIRSVGNIHRGFRQWEGQIYAGDKWQPMPRLNLQSGLRWQPVTKPTEVDHRNPIAFDSDLNNFAPGAGFTVRLPRKYGLVRGAYGTHFGEIFFVSYQQTRFSPPLNQKVVVVAPESLLNPFSGKIGKPTVYALDPELATPYSHQYNLSWEPDAIKSLRLQLGYVGSRSHKLLVLWYLNRAHPVDGIAQTTATVNDRRQNKEIADYRLSVNASRGYFDAARVSITVPNWRGINIDATYWFSKAIDLGASYTNTANENDSRKSRSQTEYETHLDMKGVSDFDQTHAFLLRSSVLLRAPKFNRIVSSILDGWNFSSVVLIKTGIPFNISTGSDAPGFGNVDGNGGDRPLLLDPSILGRTIDHPDASQKLLPRSAFAFLKPEQIAAFRESGTLGRNVFRKGPVRNVNASLSRSWELHRDLRIAFRAESVNLFNTPQFAEPGFELANPNFGAITNTLNEGRTFRFSLQLGW